jgi:hypothetical protein
MDSKPGAFEVLLYIVGAVAVGYGVIKGMIIGFYPDERVMVFGAMIIGAAALGIAGKITKSRKTAETAARDRARGVV